MRIFQDTITVRMLLNCQGVATETSKIADEDVEPYAATLPPGGDRDGFRSW